MEVFDKHAAPPGEGTLSARDAVVKRGGKTREIFLRLENWLEKTRGGKLPLVLAFLLPVLIFSFCLALVGVYPFGDGQIIHYDGWHQYYPFLMQLWDHLHERTGLLYDWSMGMGTNFLSLIAYYGASPLNLLLLFAPTRDFRILYTLLVGLRLGLAGCFTALFLKKMFRNTGWSVAFFALGYALSSYFVGYYWNVMWLDTVALYPLLCLATCRMVREGKCSLYVFLLALSLFCNYAIGYMCCFFTVLVFLSLCVIDRVNRRDLARKTARFLLSSLLGGALSAVLLLPAFFGLQNTVSVTDPMPLSVSFYETVRDLVSPLISFHEPAVLDGLPNIGTCAILSLFAFAFLFAKKISLRKKTMALFLAVFLLVSMNFSVLNFIWHGFHFTNMLPHRFAFLFCFLVVVMAFCFFLRGAEHFDRVDAMGMFLFSCLLIFCALREYEAGSILLTTAVFVLAVIFCVLFAVKRISRKQFSAFVCAVLLFESCCSSYLGVKAVGTTSYEAYFDSESGEEIFSLVKEVLEKESESSDFYRMECTEWRSLNDSCFYGYQGISQFSSSANVRVSAFLENLGMPADPESNRFAYVHGTPLADVLLGVKYLISKNGVLSDVNLTQEGDPSSAERAVLYRNEDFAGIGFLLLDSAASFRFEDGQDPFEKQNALFRALTGLEGDLFLPLLPYDEVHTGLLAESVGNGEYYFTEDPTSSLSDSAVLRFSYAVPTSSMVYVFADVPLADYVQVEQTWHKISEDQSLFSAGFFEQNETFQLRVVLHKNAGNTLSDRAALTVCVMDQALWEKGIEILKRSPLNLTARENTLLEGSIYAEQAGYLYTSIPMETECWRVFVDGEESEILPFADSSKLEVLSETLPTLRQTSLCPP